MYYVLAVCNHSGIAEALHICSIEDQLNGVTEAWVPLDIYFSTIRKHLHLLLLNLWLTALGKGLSVVRVLAWDSND